MAAYTVPFLAFLKFLVAERIFVVISDLETVTPQKSRKGEESITPGARRGFADRLVAHRTLLNFGILLKDESVFSVDDDPKRRWRNFHQVRNGQIVPLHLQIKITKEQFDRIAEMGVKLEEKFDKNQVFYTVDLGSFRWLTDPTYVGRMYFPSDQYIFSKLAIADLEDKLPFVEKEMARLSKQIAWGYEERTASRRFHDKGRFEYEYGPSEPDTVKAWEWVVDTGKEPVAYQPMPDGPKSFPSYMQLAESRYQILYHIRPRLIAVVREFELAAWEHRGRFTDRGWENVRVKRTVWQARKLSCGVILRRRLIDRTIRVKARSFRRWESLAVTNR